MELETNLLLLSSALMLSQEPAHSLLLGSDHHFCRVQPPRCQLLAAQLTGLGPSSFTTWALVVSVTTDAWRIWLLRIWGSLFGGARRN